jgi:hypothetical protein
MNTFILILHLLFNALVAAKDQATLFHSGSGRSITSTSTRTVYDTLAAESTKASVSSDILIKRSDNLYALRVPIDDQEGYIALFLSNNTAVPFCKDVSETLYEDSERILLTLYVDLGNLTTKIPVREDSAIAFCRNIKENEYIKQDHESESLRRTSSSMSERESLTGSPMMEQSDTTSTTTRQSEANESTTSNSRKTIFADESPAPPETAVVNSGEWEKSSSIDRATIQTNTRKSTVSSPTPAVTVGPHSDADHNGSLLDVNLLPNDPNSVSSKAPSKVTETAELPTLSSPNCLSSSCNKGLPTLTRSTASKPTRPSVPVVTFPPSTTNIEAEEAGRQASGTAIPHLTISSINSWYDYINSYIRTATQTGAAVSARAVENAAASRTRPAIWKRGGLGMLTQMVRKHNDEEDFKMTQNAKGLTKDAEGDKSSPTSGSRVPAGPRPSTALVFTRSSETRSKAPLSSNLFTTPSSTSLNDSIGLTPILSSFVANFTRTPRPSLTATKDTSPTYLSSTVLDPGLIDYTFPNTSNERQHSPSPTKSSSYKMTWAPSCLPLSSSSKSTSKAEEGCWLAIAVDSDEAASNNDSNVGSDASSATWDKIQNPRIVWTVVFLWILAVLQIVCGFWNFWKGARGKVHARFVGRLRWWDEMIRTAG